MLKTDRAGLHLYEIHAEEKLSRYAGRLTVDWGEGKRAWVQLAHLRDKRVAEIRKDASEDPFPGFTRFSWDIEEINAVPLAWQSVLRSVKGIYLLVCKETGKQYVGLAKGEENLWARFQDYKNSGHGGNTELRSRGRKPYQVTVLEVVNQVSSDEKIEQIENEWKKKLMSRDFGLNRN